MCRLYGFRSAIDSSVHHSLVAAENAMARQSTRHQDGWGLAYYVDRFPQIVRNDAQALGDTLFSEVSAVVSTRTFLAHIRQATEGSVRVLNCHPFQHGAWTFAHNGQVCGFGDPEVKARIDALVDPKFKRFILGDTDSERFFYAILSQLSRTVHDIQSPGISPTHVAEAVRTTVAAIVDAAAPDETDLKLPTRLNLLLTNGRLLFGYKRGVDLFFSTYKSRCPERDTCWAFRASQCEAPVEDGIVQHLLVASEAIAETTNVWLPMADDEFVTVDHAMNFRRGTLGIPYTPPPAP